ncbi:MAG: L-lactate dehydrogenase [Nitrospirota bacterium]|jgi:L-lactate dehydrogenase
MAQRYRVGIIGVGRVGATAAFALLHTGLVEELVLIDVDAARAEGEAMDLAQATPLLTPCRVWAGSYDDVREADIAIITAGRASATREESRLDLVGDNVRVTEAIVAQLDAVGFAGILLVATNPVDVLTRVAQLRSPQPATRVIGSGTVLDTARLRHLLAQRCGVDARSVHGYVLGEHGDSEIAAWSATAIGGLSVDDFARRQGVTLDRETILAEVRGAAPAIIERKGATNVAIAAALARLVACIRRDERSVLMVSTLLTGQYDEHDVCLSVPCVLGAQGIACVIELDLAREERTGLHASAEILRETLRQVRAKSSVATT